MKRRSLRMLYLVDGVDLEEDEIDLDAVLLRAPCAASRPGGTEYQDAAQVP